MANNSVSVVSSWVPNIDNASEAVTCGDRTGGGGEADPAGAWALSSPCGGWEATEEAAFPERSSILAGDDLVWPSRPYLETI